MCLCLSFAIISELQSFDLFTNHNYKKMNIPKLRLLIFTLLATAVAAVDIPLGSTLSASDPNSTWSSPNNTFTLNFITNPATTFAVTYGGTPIWTAGSTASVNSSAVLRLTPSGDLQLLPTATSATPVWSSGTANRGVSAASLQDSGEFVLKNSSGAAVWSTFDHPTDTVVPSQRFSANQTLTSGIYTFKILPNGNLTLQWNDTVLYYNSGLNSTLNSNFTNPYLEIQSIGILTISDPSLSAPLNLAYSSDYAEEGNILRFLKLDTDGNLRIYSSVSNSGVTTSRWAAVSDQCQVYMFCGSMGICSYNDSSPICNCPSENFESIDPNDSRKGCKRKVELSDCTGTETMLQLDHTRFLTYLPELSSQVFSVGLNPCRQNCLTGPCSASTALSDGSGMCFLKPNDFVSGSHSPANPSTSFLKVCPPVVPNPSPDATANGGRRKWRFPAWVVAAVVAATVAVLAAVEGGLWWWCFRNGRKFGGSSSLYALLEYASGAPVQFSYKELHKATKGYSEKLGVGGFGVVYKGILANRTLTAVKRLEGIEQGEKQFRMEVATISSTHHLNLVRLIGFCSEGKHRLLVYEFMKNGSLDSFLFTSTEDQLSWDLRYSIALGTAKGVTYLHEECRDCIVHCDIKPENILLDENYNAKVSDFGLAKLVNSKDHRYRTLTSVRGTRGYLAPEWLANLPITSKSDVYSFGMVLLEIVSGRRNFEVSGDTKNKKFTLWAYEEFDKGNFGEIVDKRIYSSNYHDVDMEQVERVIKVGFWCIQQQPSQRPMMGKVVQMLEGVIEIDKPPHPKSASDWSGGGAASSTSGVSTFAASVPVPSSSSSIQMTGILSSVSGKYKDTASLSLLESEKF